MARYLALDTPKIHLMYCTHGRTVLTACHTEILKIDRLKTQLEQRYLQHLRASCFGGVAATILNDFPRKVHCCTLLTIARRMRYLAAEIAS